MNENIKPKIGQLLYQEDRNHDGFLEYASLLFIDSESDSPNNIMVVWIAQMEDWGNGMEVYTDATAGSIPINRTPRFATDDDIMSFIETIKRSESSDELMTHWLRNIDESEDYAFMLPEERERLKNLILNYRSS